MLRSLYRTLLSYTIFRKYFATIFIILLGIVSIVEVSFFYGDMFELNTMQESNLLIYSLFGLKWILIFGFSLYFFYSFYTFKPQTKTAKEIIEKKRKKKRVKYSQQKLKQNSIVCFIKRNYRQKQINLGIKIPYPISIISSAHHDAKSLS